MGRGGALHEVAGRPAPTIPLRDAPAIRPTDAVSVPPARREGDEAGVKRCEGPMSAARPTYRFGPYEVKPAQRAVTARGEPVALGARAFDVLVALIERRDRVVGGSELFDVVWPGLVVEENNLRQQVAAVRKALGPGTIATVPGRGYRFALPLEDEPPATPSPAASAARLHHGNLPAHLPALIGREPELEAIVPLAEQAPLVTLVGPGGVGKTRLALAIAQQARPAFRDGAWLVELAPLFDPGLLTRVVANALDVHEEPERPLLDTLLDFLRQAQLLLVLDNCEHLVEACAHWVQHVLQASPGVRIVATSREGLGLGLERLWPVPPLRTAAPQSRPSPQVLMEFAATRLFVQRAVAASPSFELTAANAAAVAQVCHQLDGLPLALELAAARVKAMRVEQVAERLDDRFAVLSRGSRTAGERHQTLRSMIDWSHGLLSEAERVLLRRLSVFAGGWTLEAAESVCAGEGVARTEVLELLTRLVEKSLVQLDARAESPRYGLLESIRQYGLDKLAGSGEQDELHRRHLRQLVDFAEAVRTRLTGRDQVLWHRRVETELDNVRVALARALAQGESRLGLRLVNALHRYWYKKMHWGEIVGWQEKLARLHESQGHAPDEHYARSFYVAGMLATNYHPFTGRALCERGLGISREIGFDEGQAWALMWIGHIDTRRREAATLAHFAEGEAVGQRIADPWRRDFLLGNCYICYANYEALMGRDASAEEKVHACEAHIQAVGGDPIYIGHCRALLATMAMRRGELERAEQLVVQGLELHRAVDSRFDLAQGLAQQGLIALARGDAPRALALFREALPLQRQYPMSPWVTKGLASFLVAYAAVGEWAVAARLEGALRGKGSTGTPPQELSGRVAAVYRDAVAKTVSTLGVDRFETLSVEGRALAREQVIALALSGAMEGR